MYLKDATWDPIEHTLTGYVDFSTNALNKISKRYYQLVVKQDANGDFQLKDGSEVIEVDERDEQKVYNVAQDGSYWAA